jgi:hypothetical protein
VEYLIGLFLALAVAGLAAIIGLDRERAFYSTVLIVVASYYVLFAVMADAGRTLLIEIVIASGFLLSAIIGYKRSLWLVAIALVGHGVFDIVHHLLIENSGVPRWWPGFCSAFDIIFGGWLAVGLMRRRLSARSTSPPTLRVQRYRKASLESWWKRSLRKLEV